MERLARQRLVDAFQFVHHASGAHDEKNEFKTGDRVQIVESRPLSQDKRWRVEKLIERPQEA